MHNCKTDGLRQLVQQRKGAHFAGRTDGNPNSEFDGGQHGEAHKLRRRRSGQLCDERAAPQRNALHDRIHLGRTGSLI